MNPNRFESRCFTRAEPLHFEAFRLSDHMRPEDRVILKASRYGPYVPVLSLTMVAMEFVRLRRHLGRAYAYAMADALFLEGVTSDALLACAKRHKLTYPVRRYLGHRRRLGLPT